jgi:hypothetical protein
MTKQEFIDFCVRKGYERMSDVRYKFMSRGATYIYVMQKLYVNKYVLDDSGDYSAWVMVSTQYYTKLRLNAKDNLVGMRKQFIWD